MLQPRVWIRDEKRMALAESVDFNDEAPFVQIKSELGSGVYYFEDVVFMENTGFKDNAEKDIYKGDIVKNVFYGELFVVRKDSNGRFRLDNYIRRFAIRKDTELTIIGNVFENEELFDEYGCFERVRKELENE